LKTIFVKKKFFVKIKNKIFLIKRKTMTTREGKITAIFGCMFASKSSTLIGYYQKYQFAKRKCIVIKHAADTRYQDTPTCEVKSGSSGYIISHDQIKVKADYNVTKLADLDENKEAQSDLESCYAIIIEEGHFYEDCADFAEIWADKGKHVIIAGLLSGQNREPIPTMSRILSKAEEVIKLNALCTTCFEPASFTKLRPGFELGVGGAERYTVSCRKCYKI
jgi:thymidine kinase